MSKHSLKDGFALLITASYCNSCPCLETFPIPTSMVFDWTDAVVDSVSGCLISSAKHYLHRCTHTSHARCSLRCCYLSAALFFRFLLRCVDSYNACSGVCPDAPSVDLDAELSHPPDVPQHVAAQPGCSHAQASIAAADAGSQRKKIPVAAAVSTSHASCGATDLGKLHRLSALLLLWERPTATLAWHA
jgi:hypothetical protein